MNISAEDLKRLRLAIAAAAVLVGIGVALLLLSENKLDAARQARQAAMAARTAAQDRVARVAEEEREITQNLQHYQKMVQRGMVGTENRLDWIDTIAAIKAQRKLFDISYNIEPQKPVDYPGVQEAGTSDFVASRLRLQMALLHEEDLLIFLVDLQKASRSFVSVRRCSISRLDRGAVPAGASGPRLQSDCLLDLITLKLARRP